MPNFFKSFFSGKSETPESEKQKNDQKNFEIFKYDGLRAQRKMCIRDSFHPAHDFSLFFGKSISCKI